MNTGRVDVSLKSIDSRAKVNTSWSTLGSYLPIGSKSRILKEPKNVNWKTVNRVANDLRAWSPKAVRPNEGYWHNHKIGRLAPLLHTCFPFHSFNVIQTWPWLSGNAFGDTFTSAHGCSKWATISFTGPETCYHRFCFGTRTCLMLRMSIPEIRPTNRILLYLRNKSYLNRLTGSLISLSKLLKTGGTYYRRSSATSISSDLPQPMVSFLPTLDWIHIRGDIAQQQRRRSSTTKERSSYTSEM